MTKIIAAPHDALGTLFAAVDPAVRFAKSAVCDSRLGAMLAPFASEEAARAALTDAGAKLPEGGGK